ncbi:spermine synthase isoform X1 [Centruroides vittatus]|uniref:spermine synthase isoform X1 n=1 Tax=Centruroides vittatus TaxID=120091 RepID=UPI0035105A03
MSVKTAMLDIHVDPSLMSTSAQRSSVIQSIEEILKTYSLKRLQEIFLDSGKESFVVFGTSDNCVTCTLKTYKRGLISLTVEGDQDAVIFNDIKFEGLRKKLQELLESQVEKFSQSFFVRIPPLKRGSRIPLYLTSSDERILEYDFDQVVFDAISPYQRVQILHSPTLGNCLILDDLQNLGECDINYTHGLMKRGDLSYCNKEILILGGGDGGLLYELLKEKPKFITMVDIDKVVIDACKKYLRGACGDALDQLKGENYEVIVDDCIKIMREYTQKGKKFDYVINDLTDIPIATSPQGELWQFIRTIVSMAFELLQPNGRYLNHAIGDVCKEALTKYEELLKSLPYKVQFKNHSAYVPSFMENWVFYEVWRAN